MALMQTEGMPIYTRLPGETEKAWVAFEMYRKQEQPRKRHLLCERLSVSPANVSIFAKKHHWDERLLAYDRDDDIENMRVRRESIQKDYEAMRQVGMSLFMFAAKELGKWYKVQARAPDNEPILSIKEVTQLTEAAVKVISVVDGKLEETTKNDAQIASQIMQIGDMQILFS